MIVTRGYASSATPYNCLTEKSRVIESNIIEWFEGNKHDDHIYRR